MQMDTWRLGVGSMQTPCSHANDMEINANKPREDGPVRMAVMFVCLSLCMSVYYRANPSPRKYQSIQLCVGILEFMSLAPACESVYIPLL